MKKHTPNRINTDAWREIKNTASRFLSLFLLSALAVAFLAGLRTTAPDMEYTADDYFDRTALMDARVLSTLGLTEKDIEALGSAEGVEKAEGAWYIDATIHAGNNDLVVRFHSMSEEGINLPELVEGRLPENGRECVVEPDLLTAAGLRMGDTIRLDTAGTDYEDSLVGDTYTVVGTVTTSLYMSRDRGTSTIGTGRLTAVAFLPREAFDMEVYTEAYLRFEGLAELMCYDDAYQDRVDDLLDALEPMKQERAGLRYDQVVGEATDKLNDAQKEYDDAEAEVDQELADAEAELFDARKKLDDGWAEYYDGVETLKRETADAKKKIADAEVELTDALTELEDGEADYARGVLELEDGKEQYADGLREYADGKAELEKGEAEYADSLQKLEDGQAEYEDGLKEYEDGLKEYEDGQAELDDARRELNAARRELNAAEAQLKSGRAEYEQGLEALEEKRPAYEAAVPLVEAGLVQAREMMKGYGVDTDAMTDVELIETLKSYLSLIQMVAPDKVAEVQQLIAGWDGLREFEAGEAGLRAAKAQLDSGQAALDSGWAQYNTGRRAYNEGLAELEEAKAELEDAAAQLEDAKVELEDGWAQLADGRKELDDGWAELSDAWTKLEEARQEIEDGEAELLDARQKLDDGWAEYRDGLAELADAREELPREVAKGEKELADALVELNDGEAEYADGVQEYEDGKAEAEEELSDARRKLNDARREIAEIEDCKWYILGRNTNAGYVSYQQDAQRMGNLAQVFPLIFFLVAALVCLTTMTRMVEEQRIQIGGLKALGYSRLTISKKYVGYGFLSSFFGGAVGLAVGCTLIPTIIFNAWKVMYTVGDLEITLFPGIYLLAVGAAVVCVTGAALAASFAALTAVPATLMRPKAPQAGKRVLLERVDFIWKRLSFTWKVTVRNLFRYKKRFWMAVIGIGGCTALLITGFGLRDSIHGFFDTQYDEITTYHGTVSLDDKVTGDELLEIGRELDRQELVDGWTAISNTMVTAESEKRSLDSNVYLCGVADQEKFGEFIHLRDRKTGEEVPLTDEGAVITEKLSEMLDVGVGDTITLVDADNVRTEIPIAGITENYIFHYIYLSHNAYLSIYGEEPTVNSIMLRYTEDTEANSDAVASALLPLAGVSSVSRTDSLRQSVLRGLEGVDYAVIVVVAAAAALAFVVLYNLTNINITERLRELATLKVLGFTDHEMSQYVYRENIFLTFFGILLGLVMGKFLHQWLVLTVEIDMAMFYRSAKPVSYVLAAILTVVFSVLVNFAAKRRLRKIDMVESLKTVE